MIAIDDRGHNRIFLEFMEDYPRQNHRQLSPRGGGRNSFQRGLTLLEVMIAMAVLAIALVAVFQLQSQGLSMQGQARFETTASLLGKSKMAELEVAGLPDLRSGTGDFGDDFPGYTWEAIVEPTPLDALMKITVAVTDTRRTRNNTYHVELFRTVAPE